MSRIEFERPDLPSGWEWKALAEVVERVPNYKPELEPDRRFRYVDISAIDNQTNRVTEVREFQGVNAPSRARRPVRPDDVLLSNVRVNLRNTALLTSDVAADLCSTGFTVLRANEQVLPRYLFHYVLSDYFVKPLEELQTGTQYPATSDRVVLEQCIPIPSIDIQGEVVRQIDLVTARVESARLRLAQIPMLLKRFRRSVLAAAISDQLTEDWRLRNPEAIANREVIRNVAASRKARKGTVLGITDVEALPQIPDSWVYCQLPDLGELNRGKSKHRPRNDPKLLGGPYPLIQTGDVARSAGTITAYESTYSDFGLAQSRLWPTGTLCITIAANIAATGILTFDACFPDSVVGFNANPALAINRYVELFVRTARADLAMYAPATSQANINLSILEQVRVPVPSVEEQREVVSRVESLFALAESVEVRLNETASQLTRASQAVIARAFSGELI